MATPLYISKEQVIYRIEVTLQHPYIQDKESKYAWARYLVFVIGVP